MSRRRPTRQEYRLLAALKEARCPHCGDELIDTPDGKHYCTKDAPPLKVYAVADLRKVKP